MPMTRGCQRELETRVPKSMLRILDSLLTEVLSPKLALYYDWATRPIASRMSKNIMAEHTHLADF